MENNGLTKSSNKVLAGVCGGLAEKMGVDANLFRALFVFATIFTAIFPCIVLYIILALFLPDA